MNQADATPTNQQVLFQNHQPASFNMDVAFLREGM